MAMMMMAMQRTRAVLLASVGRRRTAVTSKQFSSSAAPPFTGVHPIMATPFLPSASEDIDVDGFQRALQFMADAGADGVTIIGVLGESNRLVDAEREHLIKAAVEVARGVRTSTRGQSVLRQLAIDGVAVGGCVHIQWKFAHMCGCWLVRLVVAAFSMQGSPCVWGLRTRGPRRRWRCRRWRNPWVQILSW